MSTVAGVRTDEINQEILPLLSNERADARYQTLDFFFGLTGSEDNLSFFRGHEQCLEAVAQLALDSEKEISKLACKTLVNLSSDEKVCETLLRLKNPKDFVYNLIRCVLSKDSHSADLVGSIICNLTRLEESVVKVVEIIKLHEDVGFDKIVEVLCTKDFNKNATLDMLGLFLSNLSQIASTRKYILDKEKCVVQRLLPYSHYQGSVIRRRGVVATLRNCCFETEYHDWLLSEKVDILPSLLLPLAGPETFDDDDMEKLPPDLQYLEDDKAREPEPEIRRMLVEAVFQLCATKSGRKYMKDKNTYIIMRELHKWEEDESVNIALEKLITILIGDEPAAEHENLQKVDIPGHLQKQFDKESQDYEKANKVSGADSEVLFMD